MVYQQQMEILERRKASREKATDDGTPTPTNQLTRGGCAAAESLSVGTLDDSVPDLALNSTDCERASTDNQTELIPQLNSA